MVASFAQGFQLPFDYVLYELSYKNAVLYSRALPKFNSKTNGGNNPKEDVVINASDPKNKKIVHDIMFG